MVQVTVGTKKHQTIKQVKIALNKKIEKFFFKSTLNCTKNKFGKNDLKIVLKKKSKKLFFEKKNFFEKKTNFFRKKKKNLTVKPLRKEIS